MDNLDGKSKVCLTSMKDLRHQAEELITKKQSWLSNDLLPIVPENIGRILHELEVHQIELELQNEELRCAHLELDHARARYFDLYDLAPVGYLTLSENGLILEANLMTAILLGLDRKLLKGNPIQEFVAFEDQDIYYFYRKHLLETKEFQECELRMAKKNGALFWVHMIATLAKDEEGVVVCRVVINEISERKKAEKEISHLNYYDYLTGLYNRRFYEEKLVELDTKKNLPITLVMIDINGLKLINDSFGHLVGDELLKLSGATIEKGCREGDIAARLGGDEFVIIFPKTNAIEAEKIIASIQDYAAKEKIGSINLSISFGQGTKVTEDESIQDIFKNAEDDMYRHKLYESGSTRSQTIGLIMTTLYEKSPREMQHSKRVSEICIEIATLMNFDEDAINRIGIAGLMHDIGKMGIDENILNKPGKLNPDEWKEMQRHPEIGYRILSSANEFSEMAKYVLEHQEKWDGSGYPKGLKGKTISLEARIISVADAYDAITSDRSYRKKISDADAMSEIKKNAGTQFDPDVVRIFTEKSTVK
ncbi:HD domain-containing phosphohydrolase [Acetobacterium bakii]|uniref:HD domain-containing phosphohydrolase n=1 Tax=Acetobacterium bakii TaxID=52689 RepID=UPI001364B5A5|nr:HD domain-containing phosphohydrolase [Acetobacterium bakii]